MNESSITKAGTVVSIVAALISVLGTAGSAAVYFSGQMNDLTQARRDIIALEKASKDAYVIGGAFTINKLDAAFDYDGIGVNQGKCTAEGFKDQIVGKVKPSAYDARSVEIHLCLRPLDLSRLGLVDQK